MNIHPSPKQHQAYQALDFNDEVKTVVFGGAAGGGKSWLGCEWLTKQCLAYPETRWFVGRETLVDLMGSTFVTFNKVWKHDGLPVGAWKFNGKYNYIQFSNGSRIDFLELKFLPSDPLYERYGSKEYTGGWIEEAGQVHFGAYDTLKSRIGRCLNDYYKLKSKILITCNPKKNWLYREIYTPWKENRLPASILFIKSLVQDNPNIESEYIENLKNLSDKAQRERLLFGNWEYDDDPAALFSYDTIQDLFTNKGKVEYITQLIDGEQKQVPKDKYLIGDIARKGRDRMVLGYWVGLRLRRIIILPDHIKADITKSANFIMKFAEKKGIRKSRILLDEDGVGGGVVDLVGCKGFINGSSAIQPDQAKFDRTKALNYANLKAQCYYKLADLAESGDIGIIEERQEVKELISEELEQIKKKDIDKDGKIAIIGKDEIKEHIGRSPDFADMIMMRMYFELNHKEPKITVI